MSHLFFADNSLVFGSTMIACAQHCPSSKGICIVIAITGEFW